MQPNELNEIINAVKNSANDTSKCDALKSNAENRLNAEQRKKLNELLSDKSKLEAFLNSPQAKSIINKFGKKGD